MSVFIFLNILWIITTCLWSSLRVKALFFLHTGDEIRIKTNETDLKVFFASLGRPSAWRTSWRTWITTPPLSSPTWKLHSEIPSRRWRSWARSWRWSRAWGRCVSWHVHECQRRVVMIQHRKWENILGNNILVSPDQSFLGFYRAAPCQRKRRNPPQRYSLLGFSLFWEEGVFTHWKRCSNPAVVSSRRMLSRCGAVTPSATGRRCARCWGASTPGPSPSTEPWATSPQESTGSDWRPGFDNLPWSSTTGT